MAHRAFFAVLLLASLLAAQKKPITLDDVFESGRGEEPAGPPVWRPDGNAFAYRRSGSVWLYNISSKSDTELFSLEPLDDAAAPETPSIRFGWKNRRVTERALQWSPSGKDLLILAHGDLFLWHVGSGKRDQLTRTPQPEHDPKYSPDGTLIAFRRDHDLYTLDLTSHHEQRLTANGSSTLLNGEPDWVYPEELELGTAYWWSPDSRSIAYLQFDTSREPSFPHSDLLGPRAIYEPQRYPRAGDPNPDVRLGMVAAAGGPTRWFNLGETRETNLLARVHWTPDSHHLAVERLNRIQNHLQLLLVDIGNGSVHSILSESDPYWINLQDDLHFLKDGREFLWSSERDGFRHLYVYSLNGSELRRLTEGAWEVTSVAGVDESHSLIYFVSTEPSPLERQLYSVKWNGKNKRRISAEPGMHEISMAPGSRYYLDTFSSAHEPTSRTVRKADGTSAAVFREADRRLVEDHDLPSTEFVKVKASDGTLLYARLTKPVGFQPGEKYPAIVAVYGGPQAQAVRNEWQGVGENEYWASRGFVIWQLDNRGSSGRGHAFESVVYHKLGVQELADQKDGVRYLISLGFVDPDRIGVTGWSYGGFMTLNCLLNAPDMFRAGVAGAPVTDWRNYDTIYTERYMGLPQENPEAYEATALWPKAANLRGKLLILHNLEDDNVLFQNTMQMANALERAGKLFHMVLYPQKTHGVTGKVRRHLVETMTEFFDRTLKN